MAPHGLETQFKL